MKLTEELANLAENIEVAKLSEKVHDLFVDDSVGGGKGVSKAIKSEISALNKSGKTAYAASEKSLVERLQREPRKIKEQKKPDQLRDLWSSEPVNAVKVPASVARREKVMAAVLPASAVLSVNPEPEKFSEMLLKEAEKEQEKHKRRVYPGELPSGESVPAPAASSGHGDVPSSYPRKTRAVKLRQAKHQRMLKEHEKRRKVVSEQKLKPSKKEIKKLEADKSERQKAKLELKTRRIIDEAAGKVIHQRGAGGRYTEIPDSVPTEIASSLRRVIPTGNPLLEVKRSILKRRLIEQLPELNNEYVDRLKLKGRASKRTNNRFNEQRCVLLG